MELPSQEDTNVLVQKMAKREELGQHVLQNKQELLVYEQKREKCREAMRHLEKNKPKQGKNSWFCVSQTTFLRFPTEDVKAELQKEQKVLREKYVETQEEMKLKINELKQMEGAKTLVEIGFGLDPVIEK